MLDQSPRTAPQAFGRRRSCPRAEAARARGVEIAKQLGIGRAPVYRALTGWRSAEKGRLRKRKSKEYPKRPTRIVPIRRSQRRLAHPPRRKVQ